jgi:hypothetical protein
VARNTEDVSCSAETKMPWYVYVAHFFGGVFFANSIPHFVNEISGRALQSPFAKPRGVGLSSSVLNVAWGWSNLVVAYLLLFTAGHFNFEDRMDAGVFGVGMLASGLLLAWRFGRTNGGDRGCRYRNSQTSHSTEKRRMGHPSRRFFTVARSWVCCAICCCPGRAFLCRSV